MQNNIVIPIVDFRLIFENVPDLYLILSPDFYILDASNAYLSATHTQRIDISGNFLFDIFPNNPGDPNADGVDNLRASLVSVLQNKTPHKMNIQKYDIRKPDGTFEERFWLPINTPVLNYESEIQYIIHRVEDVTETEQFRKQAMLQQIKYHALEVEQMNYAELVKKMESKFTLIFNASPVALGMTEVETGKYIFVNKAFENLFQMEAKDIVGKTALELKFTNESRRAKTLKKLYESGGNLSNYESDINIGTGEIRKMLISIELIEFDFSNYLLASFVDITARKQIENSLKQTNKFLDTILDNIPNMVFVKDAQELRFMRFNKAGEKLLGYPFHELEGKNDYDFFPKEQADFFTSKDFQVLQNDELLDIEEEPITTKFGERWLHTQKIPVYENDKPVYLVGISEDITEKKKQRDAILKLNKELESFTYSVSHDLRAPLRAINGYSKMFTEDYRHVLDEEGIRILNIICNNAERMGRLIDELLSFAKLGKKEIQRRNTDINVLVKNIIEEQLQFVDSKPQFILHTLHYIHCDPALMKQVFANLIGNAIKYSSKKEFRFFAILCGNQHEL